MLESETLQLCRVSLAIEAPPSSRTKSSDSGPDMLVMKTGFWGIANFMFEISRALTTDYTDLLNAEFRLQISEWEAGNTLNRRKLFNRGIGRRRGNRDGIL